MPEKDLLVQSILESNDIANLQDSALHAKLAAHINQLIINDFEELIYILYRIDVSEHKLKGLLRENNTKDAGDTIATLIIERQIQKIRSRLEHGRQQNDISEDESW